MVYFFIGLTALRMTPAPAGSGKMMVVRFVGGFQINQAPANPFTVVKVQAQETYWTMRERAIREHKALFVWIGYRCHSSAIQVPGLHYHATAEEAQLFRDRLPGGAGVIVSYAHEDNLYYAGAVLAEDVCAANLRQVLAGAGRAAAGLQAPT